MRWEQAMSVLHRHLIQNVLYSCLITLVFLLTFGTSLLRAESAAAISQGFKTIETNISPGALVSLEPNDTNSVQLTNSSRLDSLVGVVGENSLIELGGAKTEVQVVTSGVSLTLVSNINGDIVAGDKITASPVDGIGMKADSSTQIVGTAQLSLNDVKTSERTITDAEGKKQTIKIGLIPVQVNVTFHAMPDESTTYLPSFLQNMANSIAGKQVSPERILLAILTMLLAFISVAVLLYSSVKSSIISIGRNPLSESAVRKSLMEVGLTVAGILLLTLIAIYLILTT